MNCVHGDAALCVWQRYSGDVGQVPSWVQASDVQELGSGAFGCIFSAKISNDYAQPGDTLVSRSTSSSSGGGRAGHRISGSRKSCLKLIGKAKLLPAGACGIPAVAYDSAYECVGYSRVGPHPGLATILSRGGMLMRVADEDVTEDAWAAAQANLRTAVELACDLHKVRPDLVHDTPSMPAQFVGGCLLLGILGLDVRPICTICLTWRPCFQVAVLYPRVITAAGFCVTAVCCLGSRQAYVQLARSCSQNRHSHPFCSAPVLRHTLCLQSQLTGSFTCSEPS